MKKIREATVEIPKPIKTKVSEVISLFFTINLLACFCFKFLLWISIKVTSYANLVSFVTKNYFFRHFKRRPKMHFFKANIDSIIFCQKFL